MIASEPIIHTADITITKNEVNITVLFFLVSRSSKSKNKYSINITPKIHNAIIRRDVSIPSSNNRDLNSSEYPAMKNKATNI